jgi:Domain of unknown function (DUF4082)/Bacterial Ig domain/Right handed beta helix region
MEINGARKFCPTEISMSALIIGFLVMGSGSATAASLFLASDVPAIVTANDPNPVELGVKFNVASAGQITGLRFYKGPQNTGTHTAHLWSATGTLLASATFTNETTSGWQQVNLATPVGIGARTTYVVSYHSNGYYSANNNYFTRAHVASPLTAPSSSSSGGNGVYAYGSTPAFPTSTWLSSNYWVDIAFAAIAVLPPVANNDSGFVTATNVPLAIQNSSLLANDTDPNNLPLSVVGVSGPSNGTVVLTNASTVTFTPTSGYVGPATFTYTIQDTAGGTASATVSLKVQAPAPPIANNDSGFMATQNTPLQIQTSALLANDTDPNGLPLTVTGVGTATNGTVSLSGNIITFTPATGYTGPASFLYTISDSAGLTASATVSLTVNASSCDIAYTASGPIVVQSDNQVISHLKITTTSAPGINTNGHNGVQIKDVVINHSGPNPGIYVNGGSNVSISYADILNTGAPASGAASSSNMMNISCSSSSGLTVSNVRLTSGSSGIYLESCPNNNLSYVEVHDQRGPFPRGQAVQWNASGPGTLTNFSDELTATSWPEDNINVYESSGITISNGLVSGSQNANSPSGDGVMVESSSNTVSVSNVSAIGQSNGCFAIYSGSGNVTFTNSNCRDTFCSGARGNPSSNSLAYTIDPGAAKGNLNMSGSYYNLCNLRNIVWSASQLKVDNLTSSNFTPNAPIRATLCQ